MLMYVVEENCYNIIKCNTLAGIVKSCCTPTVKKLYDFRTFSDLLDI